jgi:antitoxin component YwqK of YwqJK toxin-antitoxin module
MGKDTDWNYGITKMVKYGEKDPIDMEKHGLHEWYFKGNQILSRKTWKNGKRHGLHEKFDRTGYLISSKIYKNGKLVVSLFDMSQTE